MFLGGTPLLVGLIGEDPTSRELVAALERAGMDCSHIVTSPARSTPAIKRIYAGGHNTNRRQVLRVDYGERRPISPEEERLLLEQIEALLPRVNAICLSDHARGTATRKIWMALHDGARRHKIHTVVDAGQNPLGFPGATVILQTEYELVEVLREREVHTQNEAAVLARNLQRRAQAQAVVLTRGNQGMVVVDGRKKPVHLGIYGPEDITDPAGVGETVGATTVVAAAAGATILQAARLASYAGGIAVMKPALATVTAEEILAAVASKTL
jgi:rfaE bifunctional protein kinase chain/domain